MTHYSSRGTGGISRNLGSPKTFGPKDKIFTNAIYLFQDAKNVTEYLGALAADQIEKLEKSMEEKGSYDVEVKDKTFSITKDMISKVKSSKSK